MASQIQDRGLANIISAWHAYASRAKFLGWGVGSGVGVAANNLASPANESRVDGTTSIQTVNTTGDTLRTVATIVAGGDRLITEVGGFDGAGTGNPPTGANLCLYVDFGVITLREFDAITFTINTTLDQGA